MKKTLEKKTIIFTMLATCLCGFCFQAEAAVPFRYSRTIGIGYQYNEDGEASEIRSVVTYDDQGRVSQYEVLQLNGESIAVSYSYEEDEHGKVCRITEDGDVRTEFVLENHYDGDELTGAVVTDILVDGQSRQEDLQIAAPEYGADESFYRIEIVPYCLKYYDGYENTTVRSGADELLCTCEDGNYSIVQSLMSAWDLTKLSAAYSPDGGMTNSTCQVSYYEGTPTGERTNTIVIDGDGFVSGYGEQGKNEDGEWSCMCRYTYGEERTDEKTGETYRSGTIETTEGDTGRADLPYGLYAYLNDEDEVVRMELVFVERKTVWLYEDGILTAQEQYRNDLLASRQEFYYK